MAPSPPAPASPAAARAESGEDEVDLLYAELGLRYDAQGRLEMRVREVYRVLAVTPSDYWRVLTAEYSPWYESRPVLTAKVTGPDGKVHALDPATVSEGPARNQTVDVFSDRKSVRAPLPAIGPGAVVEREVVLSEHRPFALYGVQHVFDLAKDPQAGRYKVVLEYPEALPLRYGVLDAPAPQVTKEGGRIIATWDQSPAPGFPELEAYVPVEERRWPRVWISTGKSWAEVAQGYGAQVADRIQVDAVAEKARTLTAGATTPREKAARLVAWIKDTVRYTGLAFGQSAIVPFKPAEVLSRRYGDCKDMSTLLVSMLRAVDVPAHLALLSASVGPDVVPEAPGLGFNHAIVHVPGEDPLWIDPTDRYQAVDGLSNAVQGRWALVIAPSTEELVRIPVATAERSVLEVETVVKLPLHGYGEVSRTRRSHGPAFCDLRAFAHRRSAEDWEKHWDQVAKDEHGAENGGQATHTDPLRLEAPFEQTFTVKGSHKAETEEVNALVQLDYGPLGEALPWVLFEDPAEIKEEDRRKLPVQIPYAHRVVVTTRVHAPPGYRAATLPPSARHQVGPLTLEVTTKSTPEGEIVFRIALDSGPGRYTASEVKTIRADLNRIFNELPDGLVLENEYLALLQAGRYREAIQKLRDQLEKTPNSAVHHAFLARAALQVGLGREARDLARRAVELGPQMALAHRVLGQVLLTDEVGREYKPGMDRAGALTALKRAIELSPKDAFARKLQIIALERDENGDLIHRGEPLVAVAEALRAYRETTELKDLDDGYARTLAKAGLWKRLLEEAPELTASQVRDASWLAAVTVEEGLEAALGKARRDHTDGQERAARLATAAALVLVHGRYADASRLQLEALALVDAAPDFLRNSKRLSGVKPLPTGALRFGTPEETLQAYFRALGGEAVDPDRLFMGESAKVRRETLEETQEQLASAMRETALSPRISAEILAGTSDTDISRRGEDLAFVTLNSNTHSLRLVLIKDRGGEWRVHVGTFEAAYLGKEILRQLDSGDPEGARALLEWARGMETAPMAFTFLSRELGRDLPERDRILASALAASKSGAPKGALTTLRNAFGAASGHDRRALALAWLRSLGIDERWKEIAQVAAKLKDEEGLERWALVSRLRALVELDRVDEALSLITERVERIRGERDLEALLADAYGWKGDFEEAARRYALLADQDASNSSYLNNAAWFSLLSSPPVLDIKRAERACAQTEWKETGSLNTLVNLYAHAGRTDDAVRGLRKLYSLEGPTEEMSASNWYAQGRVAEDLGFTEAAKRLYQRVIAAKVKAGNDLGPLAGKRLDNLGKKPGPEVKPPR